MSSKEGRTTTFAERLMFAATAGCGATFCVHPLDVLRFRLQLDAEGGAARQFNGGMQVAKHIFKNEGFLGLYAGISAGIFRQISYGMPRMAVYPVLLETFKNPDEPTIPLWKKMLLGSAAGSVGGVFGVPSEVCLVRMGADSKLPPDQRRNYKHAADAVIRIYKEEGLKALWGGTGATVLRCCLFNAGQLGVYSEAKEILAKKTPLEGIPLQFVGASIAAVVAVGMSNPADVIKTRMQNSKPGQYTGTTHCITTLAKNEGIFAFWKGMGPSVIKVAPHSVISFLILDNLTKFFTGKAAM